MKYSLLEWLVCPRCRGSHLKLTCFRTDQQQWPVDVLEGLLACAGCGQLYPVVAGIPRMLPDSFHRYYEYLSAYAHGQLPKPSISEEELGAFRELHKSTEESIQHYLCYAAVPLGWLKRKVHENRTLKHIFEPLLLLPVSAHEKWQVRLCDTFDWLAPQYQWKHTTREVTQWFQETGLTHPGTGERSVGVTGVMPVAHGARMQTSIRAPQ